jgi:hypothetical protein
MRLRHLGPEIYLHLSVRSISDEVQGQMRWRDARGRIKALRVSKIQWESMPLSGIETRRRLPQRLAREPRRPEDPRAADGYLHDYAIDRQLAHVPDTYGGAQLCMLECQIRIGEEHPPETQEHILDRLGSPFRGDSDIPVAGAVVIGLPGSRVGGRDTVKRNRSWSLRREGTWFNRFTNESHQDAR